MPTHAMPGVTARRVNLSIGALDVFAFRNYQHAFPRHSHEGFTVGVFGKNNGTIRVRGGSFRAAEGYILAIAPDEAHSAEPLRNDGWTYGSLYPSSALMEQAAGDGSIRPFDAPVIHDPRLGRLLSGIHHALYTGCVSLQVEERLLAVLRTLAMRHRVTSGAPPIASDAVTIAQTYIETNFARQLKLAELSQVCGVSPFHLVHSFRERTGIPPHAYLTGVRARRAREHLRAGRTVSSVAYACGFSDQSHLTRVFKRIYGITPGAYVKAVGVCS